MFEHRLTVPISPALLGRWFERRMRAATDLSYVKGRFELMGFEQKPMRLIARYVGEDEPFITERALRFFREMEHLITIDLERQDLYGKPGKILLSGSSGMIGIALRSLLSFLGWQVVPLRLQEPEWSLNPERFEKADAVIHLAGENIASQRWNEKRKRILWESRIDKTACLGHVMKTLRHPPKTWIGISGIGYYGARGEEILQENSSPGKGFLADLSQKWEMAHHLASHDCSSRLFILRLGKVLSFQGGFLPRIISPLKLGIPFWAGLKENYHSCIALEDLLSIMLFLLNSPLKEGIFNCTMPHPVQDRDFAHFLSRAYHHRDPYYLPAWIVKSILGEMATALLYSSQRVLPSHIEQVGFKFNYKDIESFINFKII